MKLNDIVYSGYMLHKLWETHIQTEVQCKIVGWLVGV